MKYTEFLQLSDILEKKGKSISDLKSSDNKIFEADPIEPTEPSQPLLPTDSANTSLEPGTKKLDTEKTSLSGRLFSKWRRTKNKLNKVAQNTQKQLSIKVINKYLPNLLAGEKEIIEKIKTNPPANPKELKKLVIDNYAAIKDQQKKQMDLINATINKFLGNITQQMNTKIDSSKSNDNNKVKLKNYWVLLTTQIAMNASKQIIGERNKLIDSIYKDKNAAKEVKNQINAEIIANQTQLQKQLEDLTNKIKEMESQMQQNTTDASTGTTDASTGTTNTNTNITPPVPVVGAGT
jgi:hypothetical protein